MVCNSFHPKPLNTRGFYGANTENYFSNFNLKSFQYTLVTRGVVTVVFPHAPPPVVPVVFLRGDAHIISLLYLHGITCGISP